jgi:hypothetical protein
MWVRFPSPAPAFGYKGESYRKAIGHDKDYVRPISGEFFE